MFPALIAGLFGVGLQELTYSDAEVCPTNFCI